MSSIIVNRINHYVVRSERVGDNEEDTGVEDRTAEGIIHAEFEGRRYEFWYGIVWYLVNLHEEISIELSMYVSTTYSPRFIWILIALLIEHLCDGFRQSLVFCYLAIAHESVSSRVNVNEVILTRRGRRRWRQVDTGSLWQT